MELQDTVQMMASCDYKERFKAEYYQVAIRYVKLMGEYIDILQDRAKIEEIDI